MPGDPLIERDQLIDDLRGAIHQGESGLNYVPRLLRKVLETRAWAERFDGKTRSRVSFASFAEFVRTPPTEGLGADMALIERIVGRDDPDLLRLLREAKKRQRGRPSEGSKPGNPCDSQGIYGGTDYQADRLAREAPDEYDAVKRGEKSINAAAISAGIRRKRVPVRLDNAESAARTLRKHMPREALVRLAELLTKEESDEQSR